MASRICRAAICRLRATTFSPLPVPDVPPAKQAHLQSRGQSNVVTPSCNGGKVSEGVMTPYLLQTLEGVLKGRRSSLAEAITLGEGAAHEHLTQILYLVGMDSLEQHHETEVCAYVLHLLSL